MAEVPVYRPTVADRPILQQSITTQASGDDFGAAIGRGMQSLGQGVQQAANTMYDLRQLEANAEAKAAHTAFSNWEREARIGYQQLSGRAAVDAREAFEKELSRQRMEFGKGLRPDAGAIYFDASNARVQSSLETTAIHAANEKKTWIKNESTARQEMLAEDAVANWDKPAKVEQSIQLGLAELRQLGELEGVGSDELAQAERQYVSTALHNVVLRQAQEDPIAAAEFVLANPERFTAEDGYALIVQLQPMVTDAAAREALTFAGNAPGFAPGSSAADILRQFEGFSDVAYNDPSLDANGQQEGEDVYRTGYGSDTITRADGTVERVTKDTVVTRADAERDLERRIAEFQVGIVQEVGQPAWSKLDSATQAALTSVAYNYGNLPDTVSAAVQTGDRDAIASAIEGLAGHNGGVNADRRRQEAALVRQGTGVGVQFGARTEAVLSAMPTNMSVQVREGAAAEMQRQQAGARARANAEAAALKDSYSLGILTGAVTSEQTILSDPTLSDGDKSVLIRSLRSEMGVQADAMQQLAAMQSGTARALNPFDGDDQKLADAMHDVLIKSVDPEQQANVTQAFIRDTGMIPKDTIADVQMGLASRDAATTQAALDYAVLLQTAAPAALGTITNGSGISDAADVYRTLVDGMGYSKDEATRRYLDSTDPDKARDREALIDSKPVADALKNISDRDVSAIWPALPLMGLQVGENEASKAAMVAEYKRIYEQAVVDMNGDLNAAKELTATKFQRLYAPSPMTLAGDRVITRLPPERTYQSLPDGSHDYIMEQLQEALVAEGVEFDEVRLVAFDGTNEDVETGATPRYQVFYRHNGQLEQFHLPFTADYEAGMDAYNERQQALMSEADARRQENMNTAASEQQSLEDQIENGWNPSGAILPALREDLENL